MSRNYVILIAIAVIARSADAAVTISSTESLEDLSRSSTAISPPCVLTSNSTLNCSNLKLSVIPKNIPKNVERLNLSHNHLSSLEEDSFDECCEGLKVLDLSHNELANLTRRHFERLRSLEVLLLGSNQIVSFGPDTFESLTKLKRLDLSRNDIQIDVPNGFLLQSKISELNLDFCNIEEFPEDSFKGLRQLRQLTLSGNPIDESIDTSAFEPLHSLLRLRIPNLSKTTIYLICEKLISIDVINFDTFNVSCTVLADDEAFEDSIISNEPIEQPVISPPVTPRKTTATTTSTTTTSTSIPSSHISKLEEITTILPQAHLDEMTEDSNTTLVDKGPAQVNIDTATIRFILIGIFVVTVAGIIIGLICRADICGVKTKMCRSKKSKANRRSPEDTVSPFEEVPLNLVNGKIVEGHG